MNIFEKNKISFLLNSLRSLSPEALEKHFETFKKDSVLKKNQILLLITFKVFYPQLNYKNLSKILFVSVNKMKKKK